MLDHYGPGVELDSNRNVYQEYFPGDKGGRCVGLTTLPPPCVDRLNLLIIREARTGNLWRSVGR